MKVNFLIIGDLSGKRIETFADCLKAIGIDSYKVITWLELLQDINVFDKNLKENTIVKIEPPEKDMEIYRELLKLGETEGQLTRQEIQQIDFSNCQVIAPKQWYNGFKAILENIEFAAKRHSKQNIFFMNDIRETIIMMDKAETYNFLESSQKKSELSEFYLPKRLETPKNYTEFKEMYGDKFMNCFIKLRYGSGGTGVLAYRSNPKLQQENIFTSLNFEILDGKKIFYSNSKVNCFKDSNKIKELIDWVLSNGAHIEEWIPKTMFDGYAFDTRSFVIDKKSEYTISRLSKTPITNLHLKNKRLETEDLLQTENLNTIIKASEGVMKIFNKSLYAGIDVVLSKNYKPYIIDVNPFGDLFHNLLGTPKNVQYLEIQKAIRHYC